MTLIARPDRQAPAPEPGTSREEKRLLTLIGVGTLASLLLGVVPHPHSAGKVVDSTQAPDRPLDLSEEWLSAPARSALTDHPFRPELGSNPTAPVEPDAIIANQEEFTAAAFGSEIVVRLGDVFQQLRRSYGRTCAAIADLREADLVSRSLPRDPVGTTAIGLDVAFALADLDEAYQQAAIRLRIPLAGSDAARLSAAAEYTRNVADYCLKVAQTLQPDRDETLEESRIERRSLSLQERLDQASTPQDLMRELEFGRIDLQRLGEDLTRIAANIDRLLPGDLPLPGLPDESLSTPAGTGRLFSALQSQTASAIQPTEGLTDSLLTSALPVLGRALDARRSAAPNDLEFLDWLNRLPR